MEINQCSHANKPTSAFHNDSVDRTRVAFFDDSMAMTNWHLRRCHWGSTAPWAPPTGHCLVQQGPLGGHCIMVCSRCLGHQPSELQVGKSPSCLAAFHGGTKNGCARKEIYSYHVGHFDIFILNGLTHLITFIPVPNLCIARSFCAYNTL